MNEKKRIDDLEILHIEERLCALELEIKAKEFDADMKGCEKWMECTSGLELKLLDRIDKVLRVCIKEDLKLEDDLIKLELRFKEMEERISSTEKDMNHVPTFDYLKSLEKKIDDLEENIKTYNELILGACPIQIDKWNRENLTRLDNAEITIVGLVDKISDIHNLGKIPHRCPLCEGQGGTFISGTMDEECHCCKGSGIVWG